MTYDGTVLGVYGFLTSRDFCRVQERAIRSSGERVMVVQRHEEIKQHRGHALAWTLCPCVLEEQFFLCFPTHLCAGATHLHGTSTHLRGTSTHLRGTSTHLHGRRI